MLAVCVCILPFLSRADSVMMDPSCSMGCLAMASPAATAPRHNTRRHLSVEVCRASYVNFFEWDSEDRIHIYGSDLLIQLIDCVDYESDLRTGVASA